MSMPLSWAELDQWGFTAARLLLAVLWQSSILFGAVVGMSWALQRRPASARCIVWLSALLVMPLLPLLGFAGAHLGTPQAPIPVLPAYRAPTADVPMESVPAVATSGSRQMPTNTGVFPASPSGPPKLESPAVSPLDCPWALLLLAYVAGAASFLVWVALGHARLRWWIRTGSPLTDQRLIAAFEKARETLRLRREIRLMASPSVRAPVTAGAFRPVILFPQRLIDRLSEMELRGVALHETAHAKRRDPLAFALVSLVRAILFFHPLVWLAARRVSSLAEQAADDAVLDAGVEPVAYARLLTRIAEELPRRTPSTEFVAGIVPSRTSFLRRVENVLSERRVGVRKLTRFALAGAVVAGLACLAAALALPLGERQTEAVAAPQVPEHSTEPKQAAQPVPAVPESEGAGEVQGRGRVLGVVVNANTGEPVKGAFVAIDHSGDAGGSNLERFHEEGSYSTAETDDQGRFVLDEVAFLEHPLYATCPGFVRHEQLLTLHADNPDVAIEIRLKPAARLDVTVLDAAGRLVQTPLLLRIQADDGRPFVPRKEDWPRFGYRCELIDKGTLSFGELDTGTYIIEAMRMLPQEASQTGFSVIDYYGGTSGIAVQAGEVKDISIKPVEHQTSLILEIAWDPEQPPDMPVQIVVSRNPGLLLWANALGYGPEDHRLGRIHSSALLILLGVVHDAQTPQWSQALLNQPENHRFEKSQQAWAPFIVPPAPSSAPYTLDNFPAGTYAIFVITVSEHMGIYPRSVRVRLVPGSEQRVKIPWVKSVGIGEANLWMFDNTVSIEQRPYSALEICTLLSQATAGRIELIADPSIQNEEARLPAGKMSIWDVLESLYLDRGWVVTEESGQKLLLKPGQSTPRQETEGQIRP